MRRDQAIEPLARFVGLVEFTNACWLWRGKLQASGYGQFSVGSRTDGSRRLVYAHRFAYEAMVAPIPDGMTIDHLCRTRICVHPDHLEAVTSRENTMRGNTISGRNAVKTHCLRGHEFTAENTHVYRGKRICRTCRATANARR